MIISFKDDEERLFHHILAVLSDKNQIMHVSADTLQTLSFPGLTIQPLQHRVIQNEKEVELTHLEFGVLLFLAEHPGWVFSKTQVYEHVWNESGEECGAAVTNVISQIRRKIGHRYITTVIGSGYKFEGR